MRRRIVPISALLAILLLGFVALQYFGGRVSSPRPGVAPMQPVPGADPSPGSTRVVSPASGLAVTPDIDATSTAPPATAPGEPTAGVSDPERFAVVRGRIWLASGGSLEGSRIHLWGGEQPGSPVDAEGYFEIRAPWEMSTACFLDHEGVRLALVDSIRLDFDAETVLEIEVEDGESIDLPIVAAASGFPVAGAKVTLRNATGQGQAGAVFGESNERGIFAARFIPAGKYTAEAIHHDFTPLTARIEVPLPPGATLALAAARPMEVTLLGYPDYAALPGSERVSLQCFSLPRPGVKYVQENLMLEGEPDADGRFTVAAPSPGSWMIEMFGMEDFPRATVNLVIEPGSDPVRIDFQLPARGRTTVSGVVFAGREPLPAGMIEIGSERGEVAEDGTFRIERVAAGRAPVVIELPSGASIRLPLLEVAADRTELAHEIRLGTAEIVTWIVDAPQIGESSPLFVEVTPVPAPGEVAWLDSITLEGPPHRPAGVPHLMPGRYRLDLRLGYSLRFFHEEEIEVRAEERIEVAVPYREPCLCRFRFVRAGGATRQLPERVFIESTQPGNRFRESALLADGEAAIPSWLDEEIPLRIHASGFAPAEVRVRIVPGAEIRVPVELVPTP